MKLKTSEAVFIAICIISAIVAVVSVYIVRQRQSEGGVTVSFPDSTALEEYDVSVINSASKEDFMNVSGIGEVKAGDILAYREALGGFDRVSRLLDVNGISDSLYQNIIDYFYNRPKTAAETSADDKPEDYTEPAVTFPPKTTPVETDIPKKTEPEQKEPQKDSTNTEKTVKPEEPEEKVIREIGINSANAEDIADALMIDYELACEIVELREKIHGFSRVQELDLCEGMTNEIYGRIKGYVLID